MNDRPDLRELLEAVRMHLESALVPLTKATNARLYFQTLVAVNVLRIAEREVSLSDAHAREEWARLNALLGEDAPPPAGTPALLTALQARNSALCDAIRAGDYDDDTRLLEHLKATVTAQLTVANPKYLASLS
jgi:hypothetical protein